MVTLCVRVWIEMLRIYPTYAEIIVTLCVRVWIEIPPKYRAVTM